MSSRSSFRAVRVITPVTCAMRRRPTIRHDSGPSPNTTKIPSSASSGRRFSHTVGQPQTGPKIPVGLRRRIEKWAADIASADDGAIIEVSRCRASRPSMLPRPWPCLRACRHAALEAEELERRVCGTCLPLDGIALWIRRWVRWTAFSSPRRRSVRSQDQGGRHRRPRPSRRQRPGSRR